MRSKPFNCWLPVSSHALHQRSLDVIDGMTVDKATLFPFFANDGVVAEVVILDASSDRLWAFDPGLVDVRLPLLGPAQLREREEGVVALQSDRLAKVAGYWHYDPWWLLRDDRFADHDATRALVPTNCVDEFARKTRKVYYSRDLRRVVGVSHKTDDGFVYASWKKDLLPTPAKPDVESEANPAPRQRWVLRPFWEG